MLSNLWKRIRSVKVPKLPKLDWYSWLDWVVKISSIIAAIIAVMALVLAFIWLVVLLYTPYTNYNFSRVIETEDGRCLRVEYPKLILANGESADVTFTVRCKVVPPAPIRITLPNELRPYDESDIASERIIPLKFFVKTPSSPQSKKIIIVNSRITKGFGIYKKKEIKVAGDFLLKPVTIEVYVETVFWAQLRDFTNNSVSEKNLLFLFISGVVPGVIAYLTQLLKDAEQRRRESKEKYKEELLRGFPNNPVLVIRGFVEDCGKGDPKDFSDVYAQLEVAGCHRALTAEVFSLWLSGNSREAELIIDDISYLEENFPNSVFSNEGKLLEQLKALRSPSENLEALQPEAIQQKVECVLSAFVRWGEGTKPLLLPLVQKIADVPKCLPALYSIFGSNNVYGYSLLKDAKIQGKIAGYLENQKLLNADELKAAREMYNILFSRPNWRPIWPSKEMKGSPKIYRWLKSHDCDPERSSFGSELVELERKFPDRKVNHPVLGQVGFANPMLVFGKSGTGKTATAYYLVNMCREPGPEEYAGAFPIYTTFQQSADIKDWLIDSVARSLVDFVSDNPRRFLNAESIQKVAVGRLMLKHAGTVDKLRITFKRSGHVSNDDWAQILTQLNEINPKSIVQKSPPPDVMDLLYMARPDGFYRTYFILDVTKMPVSSRSITAITELVDLILPLVRVDFFLKAFLPVELKPHFENTLIESLGEELIWNDFLLRNMLETRFDKFAAVCDRRTVRDPYGLIVEASHGSPRQAIRFGNALMRYAEEHLNDFDKLDATAFSTVRDALVARGALSSSGGES